MSKIMSKHPEIQAGWYVGLRNDIIEETGISDPTVRTALRGNDVSTPTRMRVIETALRLIVQRREKVASLTVSA